MGRKNSGTLPLRLKIDDNPLVQKQNMMPIE
jgi:hypothetical protein